MNKKGLALDIDETLSWTVSYWMKEMRRRFGNPEKLSVNEMIRKYRYTQNVPYWQTREAITWMAEARKSDKIQENLPLIKESNIIVRKINKIIPISVYLTTRPRKVAAGTRKWLKKYGFPLVDIIFKPANIRIEYGNKWKAKITQSLYPRILGIIDDNPELIDCLPKNYKGTVFLYDNVKCSRKDIKVIPCKTWKDVLMKVRKFKNDTFKRIYRRI